ncbi:MAG TPA: cytidylate kinase-like family protein [Prolixibacteraceae bacterium]|nr:cytidylate kinase-like family protein [Prolixibacteraceae bacterium]
MGDIFHEYMSKRIKDISNSNPFENPGPVVTFSRAAGCSVKNITQLLQERLNSISKKPKWEIISKEVLHESAERLNLDHETVQTIFNLSDRSLLDDIVNAFISRDYQLERKMLNTVVNVIYSFGIEGYKIIVGRGSNSICSNIEKSLHIRIDAPLEWRIQSVMQSKNLSRDKARSNINHLEANRRNYRQMIKGKASMCNDFDITFSKIKFCDEEIVDMVVDAMKIKKII